MHKLKGSGRGPWGFVPQPSQVTQTMVAAPFLLALRPHKTFGVTPAAADTGPQGPQFVESAGDSSSALLSTSVALGLTPCASGAQADELTTSSWPVLPGG